jgi:hypothetical protein
MEYHRLLMIVEPGVVASGGSSPLVLATQVVRVDGRRFSFQAAVLAGRQLPLVISETAIAGPQRGWALRTTGLWADHVCETPDEHWSYGLEAFALAIDDPEELLGRGFGEPTPLGWELEFEADAPPMATGPGTEVQAGVGHGLLLGPDRHLAVEGRALRGHAVVDPGNDAVDVGRWLGQDLQRSAGTGPAATSDTLVEVALPSAAGVWWVARTTTGIRTRGC